MSEARFALSPVYGIEPHPADCLNCRQAEHRMRRLIVGTSAEATHVGRLCFGCPECSRLALGGRQ